mmetsp:Transcript_25374/g.53493  ORF Transcript_25374/g.53493 Transcript_25374/m.53493 type:complete len:96 (-) Transcript_25374:489-776(-)
MLEEEGVEFESVEGSGRWKIRENFFIDENREIDAGSSSKRRKSAKEIPVEVERKDSNVQQTTEIDAATAQRVIGEEKLKREILSILRKRSPGKTC